ncbi:hypothetical protein KZZ52_04350 [Dactylosporangium sp. AC04546]|uniref:hypothetical protein n=1 Tax=Dactylosporangium sp. AC04546 TaxID=2862460 RepID=UPI001EDF47D4|nr:hypothetical protein [Dactylosporangium sp. AC04546]WVK89902.1 hypothetical protein KZZ52_04350 [Dactylosporangium sp. AC04546]
MLEVVPQAADADFVEAPAVLAAGFESEDELDVVDFSPEAEPEPEPEPESAEEDDEDVLEDERESVR